MIGGGRWLMVNELSTDDDDTSSMIGVVDLARIMVYEPQLLSSVGGWVGGGGGGGGEVGRRCVWVGG